MSQQYSVVAPLPCKRTTETPDMNPLTFKKIGSGTFGDVYLNKSNKKVYKFSKLIKHNKVIIDNTIREASFYKLIYNARRNNMHGITNDITLQRFTYPPESIPFCSVTIQTHDTPTMVFIMDHYGKPLNKIPYKTKMHTLEIFYQLAQALKWLHKHGMSHGDLKPSNILVKPDTLKTVLVDYGSLFFTSMYKIDNQRCTIYYVSPEELAKNIATPATDMWSIGVTLYEYTTGEQFLPALLLYMNTPQETIKQFIESCKENSDTLDPVKFLTNFYSTIQYSNVLALLQKKIKDRDILSIVTNCLLFDTSIRMSSEKLTDVLENLLGVVPLTSDWSPIKKEEEAIGTYATYQDVNHAGLSSDNRIKIMDFYLSACSSTHCPLILRIGKEILPHSVMLFDRYFFRTYGIQSHEVPLDVIIFTTFFLSAAILKGSYMSIDSLYKSCVSDGISRADILEFLLSFLQTVDYKVFNVSPDIYCTKYDLEKFLQLSKQYPCIHSTLNLFKAHIEN